MKKVALLYLATLKELFRERALLALTLSVAPFFLLVYRLIFLQGMIVYHIGLVVSPGNTLLYTQNAIKPSNDMELSAYIAEALSEQHYGDNTALFAFRQLDSRTEGEKLLRERSLHLLLVPRYDADSYSVASALHLDVVGDFSDPYYTLALAALQSSLLQIAELPLGFTFEQQSINIAGRKTPFESYVPGLLIVSSLALLFLFSLVTTRERENGIVIRYAMAELPVFALMLGKGAAFITLSAMSAVLAFGAAFILGFEAGPSLLMDLLLCVAFNLGCALSLIGIAFFTASYSHSVYQSF